MKLLSKNIEYHLLGNHLLENGFALYSGHITSMIRNSIVKLKIVEKELEEQILPDGLILN